MRHSGQRIAGCLDHNVDCRMGNHRLPVIAYIGFARDRSVIKAYRAVGLIGPASQLHVGFCVCGDEVNHTHDVDGGDAQGLRQKHCTEFSSPDHPNPNRVTGGCAFLQFLEKIHGVTLFSGFAGLREEIEITTIRSLKHCSFIKRSIAALVPFEWGEFTKSVGDLLIWYQ